MTVELEDRAMVHMEVCWGGCDRLRGPKPWMSRAMVALLRSEGRLTLGEYLCGDSKCPGNVIANQAVA